MPASRQTEPNLDFALESAADMCQRAVADYRSGLIDEAELRCLLYRTGLVQWPDQAWLLDLEAGRWWRYDGVALRDGGESAKTPVALLRDVVIELARGLADGDVDARR